MSTPVKEVKADPSRKAEALLLVVDVSGRRDAFSRLRDVAFRLARTRLIYSVKNDLLGVFLCGAARTNNPLAEANPGGYSRIDAVVPPAANRLRAVRALHAVTSSSAATSNFHDVLDVAGDALCNVPAVIGRSRRLIFFISGTNMIDKLSNDDLQELCTVLTICENERIQLNFVIDAPDFILGEINQFEDLDDDGDQDDKDTEYVGKSNAGVLNEENATGNPSPEETLDENDHPQEISPSLQRLMLKVRPFKLAHVLLAARATGGVVLPLSDASDQTDHPVPRSKRAVSKFSGVLDIGDTLKIPIKRFSFVAEANAPSADRLSWEATRRHASPVKAIVETQRVASARSDVSLAPHELVNAFPYGPDLVPEPVTVDTYAWHMMCEPSLQVLGFVRRNSVPQELFVGKVDVVVAMRGLPQAKRALRSLATALHTEKLGILARSVMGRQGGPPVLCFLWPRVEIYENSGAVRNCFLFAVDMSMREDVRNMPFESLKDTAKHAKEGSKEAMEHFICAAMMPGPENNAVQESGESDEEAGAPRSTSLSTFEWPNPNIDWFNICIVHRALEGLHASDLPALSKWQQQIISPEIFCKRDHAVALREAVSAIKSLLPVVPVESYKKRGRRVYNVVKGDTGSIGHFLPESDDEENHDEGGEEQEYGEVFDKQTSSAMDTKSDVTGVHVHDDVGEKTPIEDFERLLSRNQFNLAAVSLQVIIRRLIREIVDDEKAMECMKVLRKSCLKHHEYRFFNEFVCDLAQRCDREDSIGSRTAAFFRFVGQRGDVSNALSLLQAVSITPDAKEYLEVSRKNIERLCSKPQKEVSASNFTITSE